MLSEELIPEEDNIVIDINEDSSLSELLSTWKDINRIKKNIVENEEKIKNKIRIFLKEHKWDKYNDDKTNISVNIIKGQTETFDKAKLKNLLSESQYNFARKITTYEKLMIMTADDKERMKNFLKDKK